MAAIVMKYSWQKTILVLELCHANGIGVRVGFVLIVKR